ncbi:1,4-alpha-glucan branching protein GlgB [Saccharibacillus sp. CPCC 101409]|uniref:1,4-alpha-glucan branching protein GlgB n=1 Tax=Saccharibacillus sp. CPCC 101409 TaxID=3058041 RepID=UPI00267226DC|nr:1,4-alpha-glucan branching protein GlgB [Saccharibacillus sp. CPCC 101409]MDO3412872.1 1,4-alpha-glucan branching protein GlgB [Saccharibacillus sp. CPCC 101409]
MAKQPQTTDQSSAHSLSREEIYLFHEGTFFHSYRMFGAHLTRESGREGVRFTVWAPHANSVGVAMDRNDWNGGQEPLELIADSGGVWSAFIEGVQEGDLYKYAIESVTGERLLKADPYAFYAEVRPNTASRVGSIDGYAWGDQAWRRKRRAPYAKPMNIYEVQLGTWRQKEDGEFYTYRELADLLIPYASEMGYTHLEFMPVTEYPYDLSWGYQATGYFAPTSRYGEAKDLMYLIDRCHQADIGVLLDWVPGHFAKDAHGLRQFDGTPQYEYADSMLAEKPGWGTLSFDFGKPEVQSFLISSALYWLEMFHFDGLRIDAVTSMLRLDFEKKPHQWRPNASGGVENTDAVEFLRKLNQTIFSYYPNAIMAAEESSAWPLVTAPAHEGGLGFNYKWSMGWMNDTLKYVEAGFDERKNLHNLLTFPLVYAHSENFMLPLSHDEVVHGKKSLLDKMPGSYEQKFAGLRLLLGYQITHPGKKLLFMGGEFGQFIEWKDEEQLDWLLLDYEAHRQMKDYTAALNHFYLAEKALWEIDHDWDGYEWISASDTGQSVIAYTRKGKKPGDTLHILINFKPVAYDDYRIGVGKPGTYREVFSSDEARFGGGGLLNEGTLKAEKQPWHERDYSLSVKLPALGIVILKKSGRIADVLKTDAVKPKSAKPKAPKPKTAASKNDQKSATRKGKA